MPPACTTVLPLNVYCWLHILMPDSKSSSGTAAACRSLLCRGVCQNWKTVTVTSFQSLYLALTQSEATCLINRDYRVWLSSRQRGCLLPRNISASPSLFSHLWLLTCSFHSLIVYNSPPHLSPSLIHTGTLTQTHRQGFPPLMPLSAVW